MATHRPSRPVAPPKQQGRPAAKRATLRALQRQIGLLTKERDAERARHARQLAALRRASDRRLAALVGEIATLRHHEARADALTRMIGERDSALEVQGARLARLEVLLAGVTTPSA